MRARLITMFLANLALPLHAQGSRAGLAPLKLTPTAFPSSSVKADSGKRTHWFTGLIVGTAVGTALGINGYHNAQRDGTFNPTSVFLFCVMVFSGVGLLIGEAWQYH